MYAIADMLLMSPEAHAAEQPQETDLHDELERIATLLGKSD